MQTVKPMPTQCRRTSVLKKRHTHFADRSLLQSVAGLFFPLLIATGVSSGIGICDVYLSGLIGPVAQAAVGIGDQIIFLSVMLGTGLATACSSFVSRAIGAGKHDEAGLHARNSLLIAILTGVLATCIGVGGAPYLLLLFDCDKSVATLAVPYIQICSWANIPFMLLMSIAAVMRASGRPTGALAVWCTTSLLTVFGSLAFFFVEGSPAGHNITAIAYAWIFGALAGMILGLFLMRDMLLSKTKGKWIDKRFWNAFAPLLLATAPAVLSELFIVLSNITTYRLLSGIPESTQLQAAWAVKSKVEQILAIVPLLALSFACEVIVGRHVGAGMFLRARQACAKIVVWGGSGLLVIGLLIALSCQFMSSHFCADAAEAKAVEELLGAAAVVLPGTAVTMLVCAGLDGQGKMMISMAINMVIFLLKASLIYFAIDIVSCGLPGLVAAAAFASVIAAGIAVVCFDHNFAWSRTR